MTATEQYEKNLRVLDRRYPYLFSRVKYTGWEGILTGERYVALPVAGGVALSIGDGADTYALVSQVNPQQQAVRFVRSFFNETTDVFICFGLAAGWYLTELLHRMAEHQKVVVLEPDAELFMAHLRHIPLEHILADRRIFLMVDNSTDRAGNMLRYILWKYATQRLSFGFFPSYANRFCRYAEEIKKILIEESAAVRHNEKDFITSCQTIRELYFNEEDMMGDLAAFFERIEAMQAQRPLTDIEQSYLFTKMLFFYKSYTECSA